jgi:hypothetical protein
MDPLVLAEAGCERVDSNDNKDWPELGTQAPTTGVLGVSIALLYLLTALWFESKSGKDLMRLRSLDACFYSDR